MTRIPSTTATAQSTGLPESAISAIQQVLATHPEVEAAILYGSRALGRHRTASDIDLTLMGPAISSDTLARIDADLDDLLLPWIIDLSNQAAITHPGLLEHIARAGQVLYRRADLPEGWGCPEASGQASFASDEQTTSSDMERHGCFSDQTSFAVRPDG